MGWDMPPEPPEAQPPAGIRLDDEYLYQGDFAELAEKRSTHITYIDDVEDEDDWDAPMVAPQPEPSIV